MPLSIELKNQYRRRCLSDGCLTIWNGKIARCPTLMYIGAFNKYFNVKLPDEGILTLDTGMSGAEILEHMKKAVPLCAHCIDNMVEWGVCGKNPSIKDFAV